MDGTFEPIHKCVDSVVETHAKYASTLNVYRGEATSCCKGNDDCPWNYEYLCGCPYNGGSCDQPGLICHESFNWFKCADSFVCATISLAIRTFVCLPIYCVCLSVACCGYCLTNHCCDYMPLKERYEAWEKKHKTTIATKVTHDHLGRDVGGIIGEYLDPPRQSMA